MAEEEEEGLIMGSHMLRGRPEEYCEQEKKLR